MLGVFEVARRGNVPIYVLDPRGGLTPDEAVRGGIGTIHSSTVRGLIAANIRSQQNFLSEVASNTGGRAFTNLSDLQRAVDNIVAENGSFYQLGYYPDHLVSDGRFHEIKVRVTREGMRVRARPGFVAPPKQPTVDTQSAVLATAMKSAVNVSGLPVRLFAAPLAIARKGVTTALTLEISYPSPPDGSRRIEDTVQMSLVALDADANVKAMTTRALRIVATSTTPDVVRVVLDDAMDLPSQRLTVRAGVTSRTLGTAGTTQIVIDVPKASDGRLRMSGVAVGVEESGVGVFNQAAIAGIIPFQPTTLRRFGSSDTLRIFGRIFWKGPVQPELTLTLQGGRAPQVVAGDVLLEPSASVVRVGVFNTTLALKNQEQGSYGISVDAKLPDGQTARRVVPFEIR
jgi:hypothetical protein